MRDNHREKRIAERTNCSSKEHHVAISHRGSGELCCIWARFQALAEWNSPPNTQAIHAISFIGTRHSPTPGAAAYHLKDNVGQRIPSLTVKSRVRSEHTSSESSVLPPAFPQPNPHPKHSVRTDKCMQFAQRNREANTHRLIHVQKPNRNTSHSQCHHSYLDFPLSRCSKQTALKTTALTP